jgi:4'-phosphopantetheinyl transferase EntD
MLIKFSVFTRQKAVIFIAYLSLFLSSISNADSEIIITNDLKEVNQKYQELYENYPPETILIIFSIKKVLFKSLFPSFAKLFGEGLKLSRKKNSQELKFSVFPL